MCAVFITSQRDWCVHAAVVICHCGPHQSRLTLNPAEPLDD